MQQMAAIFRRYSKSFFSRLNWEQFEMINIPRGPSMEPALLYTLPICSNISLRDEEVEKLKRSHAMKQQNRTVDQNRCVPLASSKVN